MSGTSETVQTIYTTGLRNAHAMETQAIELLQRQVDRLQNYPEMEARIRQHITESEQQRSRLEQVLGTLSETHSALKDTAMGILGNLAAMGHTPAADEVIKNTMANFAFEHYEMAAYKILLAMADAAGHNAATSALRQNLQEEEAMARWIDEHINATTMMFLRRSESGQKADR
jgi:ferritin-like metal-binding protein YciE